MSVSFHPDRPSFYAARELNGEVLLAEVQHLRDGQVGQAHISDCAMMLRALDGKRVSDAHARLREVAEGRFVGQPALGELLIRWSDRLVSESDVTELVRHVQRLALVSGALWALWRTRARLSARLTAEGSGR